MDKEISSVATDNQTLEQKIIDLVTERLETGEKLPPEKQLIKEFNVSRSALREVLRAFELSGILTSIQGSGRYVQVPNLGHQIGDTWSILLKAKPEMLLELLEIRKILEINSLDKAMERAETEQIQTLGELVKRMKDKASQGRDFVAEDREFHRILFNSTGNLMLEQLLTSFWSLFEKSDVDPHHGDLVEVASQHEEMLDAFIKQDLDTLAALAEEQFIDARYRITKSLIK